MDVVVFDFWGDYGHFKKFHTTASPLTFSFPPPTAVVGLVSAILGLDKDGYWQLFTKENSRIAIRIMTPVKKIRLGINVIDTKSSGSMMNRIRQRSQIKYEYLKDAHYRIYFSHDDNNLMDKLAQMLSNHQTVYTLSLGSAQMLMDFKYIGRYESLEVELLTERYQTVHSVFPLPDGEIEKNAIQFEEGRHYNREIVAARMTVDRQVYEYRTVLFDMNANSVGVRLGKIYQVGEDYVAFM